MAEPVLFTELVLPKGDKGDPGEPGPPGPNTVPTNEAIAAAVVAPGPAKIALDAAFAPQQPRGVRATAAAMGDSNTANPSGAEIAGGSGSSMNWFDLMVRKLDGAVASVGRFARGTYTTAQVRDSKLAAMVAARPGVAFVMVGTNDVSRGGDGSGFNIAEATAALEDIIMAHRANNTLPAIVTPIPPTTAAGAQVLLNDRVWRRRLHDIAARFSLPIFDGTRDLVDPATGGIKAAYQQDLIHINALGHRVLADSLIAQGVGDLFPHRLRDTVTAVNDPTNLITSGRGLFLSSAAWTSLTAGDTTGYAVTTPTPTDASDVHGNWQDVYLPSTGTVNRQSDWFTPAVSPAAGDIVNLSCRVETAGIEAAAAAATGVDVKVRAEIRDASGSTALQYVELMLGSPKWTVDVARATLSADFAWPAGGTRLRFQHQISGASAAQPVRVRVAELSAVNRSRYPSYP